MNILMILANPFTFDARVYNEAKSLVDANHNVTILAWDKKGSFQRYDVKDGIKIIRSYNSNLMKMCPYDIFKLHLWWRKGYEDALNIINDNRIDVIHCHDFSSLPMGVRLKNKTKLPLIYDAHEIWGYMVEKDLPSIWAKYYIKKEEKLVKDTDHIITVAEPHRDWFRHMNHPHVSIVRNCKRIQNKNYNPPSNKHFTLLYIGGLSKIRFLLETIEVVNTLKNVSFKIAGYGDIEKEIIESVKYSNNGNIKYLGKIPMKKVVYETCLSDAVLCVFDPSYPNNQVGPPNKIFEAMVCGRPVIATKGIYSGNLVEKLNMGITINYNKKDLVKAIKLLRDNKELREQLGKNAFKAALSKFNWKNQERRLLQIYKGINT